MARAQTPDIICIGAVLWDLIGRSPAAMHLGADMPGRIVRLPGGVAMNVAITMRRFGLQPAVLTAIGEDAAGDELMAACAELGIDTSFAHRCAGLPTDRYMAIEDTNGLVAAIADAHTLEAAGAGILTALEDGRLGTHEQPWGGLIALDGNLTESLLKEIASSPLFRSADLRVAPASPGKVRRLMTLLGHPHATLYVNIEEAGLLCDRDFQDSSTAVKVMLENGARRVLVTDGPRACAEGDADSEIQTAIPPLVNAVRCTGAGDTFMAAHIAAEHAGKTRREALGSALQAAARYVSGETVS